MLSPFASDRTTPFSPSARASRREKLAQVVMANPDLLLDCLVAVYQECSSSNGAGGGNDKKHQSSSSFLQQCKYNGKK